MKRAIKREFRKARRNVCRYIVGFDTCPDYLKKNRKKIAINALTGLAFAVGCSVVLMALMLMA